MTGWDSYPTSLPMPSSFPRVISGAECAIHDTQSSRWARADLTDYL